MIEKFFAIVTNTFTETLRQPVFGVILAVSIGLLALTPSLIMFTLDDDNLLLKDVGLSTLLVAGLIIGVFTSASVVSDEIENKTTLTIISKTVSRPLFIVGKFFGIAAAVILSQYILSIVLMMTVRHGIIFASRIKHDMVVIVLGIAAAALSFFLGLLGNYFYRWRFSSVAILCATIFGTILMIILIFLDPTWTYSPHSENLPWELLSPIALIVLAVLTLTAIAMLTATRFNLSMSLFICLIVFILGIMLEHWLGPVSRNPETYWDYLAWIPLTVIPSISYFVVTNAIYQESPIPIYYLAQSAIYACFYVTACLLFAIALFQRREIG
ncbi:MAG: hypothetical protein GY869_25905 [Planctomycetes bacterium]|nr:hypothetical protein [Planctomycetota bacterium]